jgi:sRNA-binding protein
LQTADAEAAIVLLAELFPRAFAVYELRRRPLKLGIRDNIIARIGDVITPRELAQAMRLYCRNTGYLQAVARGDARVDLDGNAVGVVSAEHSAQAATELKIRAQREAKRRKRAAAAAEPPKPLGLADLRRAGQLRQLRRREQS